MNAKRFFVLLLAAAMTFLPACAPKQDRKTPQTEESALEKDYVYCVNPIPFSAERRDYTFQAPQYAFNLNAASASMDALARIPDGGAFSEHVFTDAECVSTCLRLSENGTRRPLAPVENLVNSDSGARIIESGRYVQRVDLPALRFAETEGLYARFEALGMRERIVLTCELYALRGVTGAELEFCLDPGALGAKRADGRLRLGNGAFTVLPGSAAMREEEGTFVFSQSFDLGAGERKGFELVLLPGDGSGTMPEEADVSVSARQIAPLEGARGVTYDAASDTYSVDLTGTYPYYGAHFQDEAKRKALERVALTLKNETDVQKTVGLRFFKDGSEKYFNVSSLSPMLRDADTLEPVGIPVQISKNWHAFGPEQPAEFPERFREGYWYNGYASVTLAPGEERRLEYTCAYHEWGGAKAANHAQLCLVGFGGNTVWDESAVGAYGEAFCYSVSNQNHCFVADVRALEVASPDFNNDRYNFSGNLGGADFLNYVSDGRRVPLTGTYVNYRTQAPNLTDVRYVSKSADGKIAMNLKINLGRTNDVSRTYYTFRYDFLEDVSYDRLTLFQMGTNQYQRKTFTRYARGNAQGILEEGDLSDKLGEGFVPKTAEPAAGEAPWFMCSGSTDPGENADLVAVVRSYEANVNGETVSEPRFSEEKVTGYAKFPNENVRPQLSYQISPPAADTIRKGSYVEFCIEYTVLPHDYADYGGTSDWLSLEQAKLGTAQAGLLAASGNNVRASVSRGTLLGILPTEIAADAPDGAGVLCAFSLTGGLGHTPVTVRGVPDWHGVELQVREGGGWRKVDQSVFGNDFWQVRRNTAGNGYDFTYNVENSFLTDYARTNEYRLVLAG